MMTLKERTRTPDSIMEEFGDMTGRRLMSQVWLIWGGGARRDNIRCCDRPACDSRLKVQQEQQRWNKYGTKDQ